MAKPIKIKILGDASNFNKAIGGVNSKLGGLGKAAKKVAKVGAFAMVGLGVAAVKFAADFEDSRNSIAVATGATGEDLNGLFGEFKDVLKSVPGPMKDVSDTVGAMATQLGLSGNELERVTRLGVEFGQVLDLDVGKTADDAARVMNQFGVSADDADEFFGDLLKTTQDFGVDANALLGDMENMGPALQAIGFGAEGAAAFLGEANQAGLNVTRLKSPLLQFADAAIKAGQDPAEAFAEFTKQAQGLTDSTELLALANKTFGTTGGAAIAEMIEAGIDLDQLNDSLGDNAGLVSDAAAATRTWQEKLQILRNKVLVKIEPVLAGITSGLKRFAGFLEDDVGPAIQTAIRFFQNFGENFEKHKPIIVGVGVAIASILVPAIVLLGISMAAAIIPVVVAAAPFVAVAAALGGLAFALTLAYEKSETFRAVVDTAFAAVKIIVKNVVGVFVAQLGFIIEIGKGIIEFWSAVFTGDFGRAWDAIKQIVTNAVGYVIAPIRGLIDTVKGLWDLGFLGDAARLALDGVVFYFTKLPGKIIGLYGKILSAAAGVGKSILGGIAQGISGAVSFAGDIATQVGNAIRSFINANIIDKFNRAIEFKIGLPFGRSFTVNPPDIPHLAGGGPFSGFAVVGDSPLGRGRPELIRGSGTVLRNAEARGRTGPAGQLGGPLVGTLIINNGTPGEILQTLRLARRTSAQ